MRTIIETEILVPNPEKPGFLLFERRKTYEEVYRELVEILKEENVFGELDRFTNHIDDKKKEIPYQHFVSCSAKEGGNEGHHIRIDFNFGNDKSECAFVGKTFLGLEHAIKVSNICTRAFYR